MAYSVETVRKDFPWLSCPERPAYLDNAATSQKPQTVLDTLVQFYSRHNANVHRSSHTPGMKAEAMYEDARMTVARFIGASNPREIVFTAGTTMAINGLALSFCRQFRRGDRILVSAVEHHSNLVPWQMLAECYGLELDILHPDPEGMVDPDAFRQALTHRTVFAAVTHISNVIGMPNRIEEIVKTAHEAGALVLVDGAQSVPHIPVDVGSLDCDFLVFSGHKMGGPMGIGVVYGKESLLEALSPPWYGGGMISTVGLRSASWNALPWRLEAGTPNVAGAVALAAAMDYLSRLGMKHIHGHVAALVDHFLERIGQIPGVHILGPKQRNRQGTLVSIYIDGMDSHTAAAILDMKHIAVRAGKHCAYPLADELGVAESIRVSPWLYNNLEEIDKTVEALEEVAAAGM